MNVLEILTRHSSKLKDFYKAYVMRNDVNYLNVQVIDQKLSKKVRVIEKLLHEIPIVREVTIGFGKEKLKRLRCISTPNELVKFVRKSFEKNFDLYLTVNLGTINNKLTVFEQNDITINIHANNKTSFVPFLVDRIVFEIEYKEKKNGIIDKLRNYALNIHEVYKKILDVEPLIVFTGTKSIHVHILLQDYVFIRDPEELRIFAHAVCGYIIENVKGRLKTILRKLMDRRVTFDVKRVVRVPFANRVDGEHIRIWYIRNSQVHEVSLENLQDLHNVTPTAIKTDVLEFLINETRQLLRTEKIRKLTVQDTTVSKNSKSSGKANVISLEEKWKILIEAMLNNNIKLRDCRKRFAYILGRWCFRTGLEKEKCLEIASKLIDSFDSKYAKIIESQYNERFAQYLMNPIKFITAEEWYMCTEESELVNLIQQLFNNKNNCEKHED